MKKQFVSLLLLVCLAFGLLPALPAGAATSGTCGDNLTWTLDDSGTLTISGSGAMWNFEYKETPWYSSRNSITNVSIGENVTTIGDYAFELYNNLTSITIGNSVTTIGKWAFSFCESLTSVTIPNSVTTIGESAFSDCGSLTSVTLGDSVTTIGDYAFHVCNSLTSVTIPDSVTTIGESAFSDCGSLTNITVDKNNTTYCSVDGNLFYKNKTELIQYPIGKTDTHYTIPSSVTTIGDGAFSFCESLTSITIPDSVTTIGNSAFFDCVSLASVIIPDSVTTIGDGVFSFCESLTSITIPDSVTTIRYAAFSDCGSLTSVTIPNSVTFIGSDAFSYCDSLTDVYYNGTKADWETISIDSGNAPLTSATIHFRPYSGTINNTANSGGSGNGGTGSGAGEKEDIITALGNSFNLTNGSFASFGATEDTLRGPKITILGKSFYLFELPINMSIKTPLYNMKYNADSEKFEVMLGKLDKTALAGEDDENKTYHEIKEFVNYCGKSTTTDTWNRYQHLRKVLKADSMSFGFSFNATPAGYMEFDKTGKLLEGAIVYVLNMDYNVKNPIPAVPIVYVKVGIGVDATGKFGIKSIETNDYSLFGSLGLDVAPYVGVGLGSSKIINVEGGAKIKLKTQLELIRNKQLNEIFSASMTGQLYLKLKALCFINFDKKWDIASVSLYPDFGASLLGMPETYDEMVLMPRDYINEPSAFVANNSISLLGLDSIDVSAFKTNLYPNAEPQLVQLADGRELLVWIDDDSTRADINRTVLKYSVNDGTAWSEPADIYNNGTADFSPRLAVTDTGAALVWQKANSVLADDVTLPEMAQDIDIYYSDFDGAGWTTPVKLTDNADTYEFAPDIAVSGEEMTVAWMTNSENDYFAFSGTNSIYSATYSGTWGEAAAVAADLGCVSNLNVSYIDGKAAISYTEDGDGNVETSEDVELFEYYEGDITQITDDSVIDYGVTKTAAGYYWIHNNQLWERNAGGVELIDIPVLPVYLDNAQILTNGADKVIVYEQAEGYSSDLYAMYYDSDDGAWGEPVRLTEDNKKIRETSGYMTADGALRLAFGQAEIDEAAEDIYGTCNLMLANITEKCDVQVTSAGCVYNDYTAGEAATVYVNIQNNSTSKISQFNVTITAEGLAAVSQDVEAVLASGGTAALELPFTLPADLSNRAYTVTVTPTEKTDDDLSNNTAAFEMGFADVAVVAEASGSTVTASLANTGYLPAQNIICTMSTADGTVLGTQTVDSLSVGGSQEVQFANVEAESVVVSVTSDSEENLYANNTASLSLVRPEKKGVHVALAEFVADSETLTFDATVANDSAEPENVSVYIAFYKEGRLIHLQTEPVTLDGQSSQIISRELASQHGADAAKAFVWKDTESLSPFNEAVGLTISYPEK